ncbi:MAG: hypothetical protein ACI9OJ_003840 [Myxococcota bacterium]|jgi:hypothetical protein
MSNHKFPIGRGGLQLTLLLAGLGVCAPASAQQLQCSSSDTFPCGIALDDLGIQKVPAVFKFQARVSQAKLPIGEGKFGEVVVRLLEGDQIVCLEEFQEVEVRDSVLNLEIGRNMSCELDEKIARGSALAFQVCLGSANSCLKPIELATVPYAVKASFSQLAQSAHDADEAAVAHYAFRAAADRDLNLNDTLSTGYFDFHSIDSKNGYLMWTPIADATVHNLTITGKNGASDTAVSLDTLSLGSATTIATGDLFVEGAQTVNGDLNVASGSRLFVSGDINSAQNIMSGGNLTVGGQCLVSDGLVVQSGGITVTTGGLIITGDSTFNSALHVVGNGAFGADLTVEGDVVARGTMVLRPKIDTTGAAGFAAMSLGADDLGTPQLVIGPRTPDASVFSEVPSIHVAGPLHIDGGMTAETDVVFKANSEHEGTVIYRGTVDFRDATAILGLQTGGSGSGVTLGNYSFQGEFMSHDGISVLRADTGTADLRALGGLDVGGVLQATGGLNVLGSEARFSAPATFTQSATFQDRINLRLPAGQTTELFTARTNGDVHLDENNAVNRLIVEAPTTFAGGNVVTEFEGEIAAHGPMTVDGTLTAQSWVRLGSGWRARSGEGFQAVVGGAAGNYQTVLNVVGGQTVVLAPDNKFGGGVQVGSALIAKKLVTAEAGLDVKHSGSTRLRVDASEVRMLSNAEVVGEFEVDPLSGPSGLTVTGTNVHLHGNSGTTHQVDGSVQISGAVEINAGISGYGFIKTVHSSCVTVQGLCPNGKWSVGVVSAVTSNNTPFGGSAVIINTRCCAMELTK